MINQSGSKKIVRRSKRQMAGGESLSNRANQQIRDEILSGDLSIGDILSRRRLAERLKMSFLPITEALGRLETEGLVESRPRIGTRVRVPTEQDIRDSSVIREALESQAARLSRNTLPRRRRNNSVSTPGTWMNCIRCVSGNRKTRDSWSPYTPTTWNFTCESQISPIARDCGVPLERTRTHLQLAL